MRLLKRAKVLGKKVRLRIADPMQRAELYRRAGVRIGAGSRLSPGVDFGSEPYLVSIGRDCQITSDCQFVTHGGIDVLRGQQGWENADLFDLISVGDNVYIGMRSIILPGAVIGDDVLIGAGSVVSGNIPSGVVAAGVPCGPIKTLAQYQEDVRPKVVHTRNLSRREKETYLRKHFGLELA